MKLIIVTMLLALLLIPNIALADTVKLIDNTDRCKYRSDLEKDYCYSVYEICDDNSYDTKELDFAFKQERGISAIKKLDYVMKETDTLDPKCKRIKIEAYKNPYINIDNIPIYKGIHYKQFAWWNTSYLHKLEINASINAGTYEMNVLLNDSYVFINDTTNNQIIWCNYTLNTTRHIVGYFYWSNSTHYNCVDRTQTYAVEMFIDEGNETNYGFPSKDIIIWWHANETADESIYNIDLTNNGCTRLPTGKIGNSYWCDRVQTDYVTFANSSYYESMDTDEAYSWCIWLNIDDWNIGVAQDRIIGNNDAISYPMLVRRGTADTFITWIIDTDGGDETVNTGTLPPEDTWFHLCGTLGGAFQKIFINGSLKNTNVYDAGDMDNWNNITLACRIVGDRCIKGQIDEFTLWNRTLTDDEVRALYENQAGIFNIAPLGNQTNIPTNITPAPPEPLPVTLTCDVCKELPIRNVYCSGNNKITIRERTTCTIDGCFTSNQTDVLYCAFGCEDNLTSIGAECVPTTFETLYTGWGLFLIVLVVLLFGTFILKKKKRKGKRWL